jgi:glycosyltransferase involved in cell wall biosynthesis
MRSKSLLVSIIISNYNYAHFLPEAIESALNQIHEHVEIIVVDDGSTDSSHEIIESYGGNVIKLFKDNGGQGSAFNAGFAASTGDLVCFLDPDDRFLPNKASVIVDAWRGHPTASVIYHQLSAIDTHGNELFSGKPWPRVLLRGSIREQLQRSGGWWPCPTTSGLCFPRAFLEKVMPMPTSEFVKCADAYLAGLAPYFGSVVGIGRRLTLYRIHGENVWQEPSGDAHEGRRKVRQYELEHQVIKQTLMERFGVRTEADLDDHYLYLYHRRNAGDEIPVHKVMSAIWTCPLIPPYEKARESGRVLLRRA